MSDLYELILQIVKDQLQPVLAATEGPEELQVVSFDGRYGTATTSKGKQVAITTTMSISPNQRVIGVPAGSKYYVIGII
jgi:hypothetical protein